MQPSPARTWTPLSWLLPIRCTKFKLNAASLRASTFSVRSRWLLTKADAERAVGLCGEAGLVLGMGHERRFEPPIADILKSASGGHLGRLLQIEANFSHDKFKTLDKSNWRLDPQQAPVAGMTATGIHLTDQCVKLLGAAYDVRVSCETLASDFRQGDSFSAHIRFKQGGTAYVICNTSDPFCVPALPYLVRTVGSTST
jgi:predicted dehydrogenase